ncbi:uncharacterized protein EV420DRAFT_1506106, partial [Desarmillaria tabescens]
MLSFSSAASLVFRQYDEPVCTPCGYLFCLQCVTNHLSSTSPDGFTGSCPKCRIYYTRAVQVKLLPGRFRQFIMPRLRHGYFDRALVEQNGALVQNP